MTGPVRRRSPGTGLQPSDLAWALIAAAILLTALLATLGVAVACLLFGGGWTWPRGIGGDARLLRGLVTGTPTLGLPGVARASTPSPLAIYIVVALTVLTALVVLVVVTRWLVDLLGEGGGEATGGFATRGQARAALAGQALPMRRVREIRPDLFENKTSAEVTCR